MAEARVAEIFPPHMPSEWRSEAVCVDMGYLFLPATEDEERQSRKTAKKAQEVCATCPVIEPCLEYAYALDIRYGVWGGMTAAQRRDAGSASLKRRWLINGQVTVVYETMQ